MFVFIEHNYLLKVFTKKRAKLSKLQHFFHAGETVQKWQHKIVFLNKTYFWTGVFKTDWHCKIIATLKVFILISIKKFC